MDTKQSNDTITMSVKDYVYSVLGHYDNGKECSPIPMAVAVVLRDKIKDSTTLKLEFENKDGKPLPEPLLWWYSFWQSDYTTYMRRKVYSEKQFIAREIELFNIRSVTKVLMKSTGMREEDAMNAALTIVKKNNEALYAALGVTRIARTKEDL